MEVTIAMGHFCDTHGPCVIMCTDRAQEVPEEPPLSLNVPVCKACRSVDLDTIYACQDEDCYYVSTRTSLDNTVACILKDAVLRSLSVEIVQQEHKRSGTMYFGDDSRGHIIAHVFDIKDSLARGFIRKYCIIVFGKYQIPLLHHYRFIENTLQKISSELRSKADKTNASDQLTKSQRDVRQSEGYSKTLQRCLADLVGERQVFAHLHMWFVFLLRAEIFRSIPHNISDCPVECLTTKELRALKQSIPEDIFKIIAYCVLTGLRVEQQETDILRHFYQLLPKGFNLPLTGSLCKLTKLENSWKIDFKGSLPKHLPTLQQAIDKALGNKQLPDAALQYHLMSLILRWFNTACVLSWAPVASEEVTRSLELRNCDMPLLSYWIPQSQTCVKISRNDWTGGFNVDQFIPS